MLRQRGLGLQAIVSESKIRDFSFLL